MHPGQGDCDGTFRSKRYFTCPPDSGVFVGLDRLRPREDPDSNSPKRVENTEAGFKSRLRGTVHFCGRLSVLFDLVGHHLANSARVFFSRRG